MPVCSLNQAPVIWGIHFITLCLCLLHFQESTFISNENIWADCVLCQSGPGGLEKGAKETLSVNRADPHLPLGRGLHFTALLSFPPNLRFHREMIDNFN